jgi:F-type H+-transporting ATPase subunit a
LAFLKASFEFFDEQLLGGFSPELARALFPLITTLFLYVLFSNWLSVIPRAQSPTQNLNVTMGLALMVYALSHVYAIRVKGAGRHLRSYLEPYPFLLPMNMIGDFGRTLSHGFRLFGNIFGGAILTTIVVSLAAKMFESLSFFTPFGLVLGVGIGTFLNFWFGVFIGAIQALVFALLASVYIRLVTT